MSLEERIDALCKKGDALQDQGDLAGALAAFTEAWALLPDPERLGALGNWIQVALADVLFLLRRYEEAERCIIMGLITGDLGNSFIHLRAGQIRFELGNREEPANELLRALLLGGEKVFAEESPKYWDFITTQARPPEGMSSWKGFTGVEKGSPTHDWLMDPRAYRLTKRT